VVGTPGAFETGVSCPAAEGFREFYPPGDLEHLAVFRGPNVCLGVRVWGVLEGAAVGSPPLLAGARVLADSDEFSSCAVGQGCLPLRELAGGERLLNFSSLFEQLGALRGRDVPARTNEELEFGLIAANHLRPARVWSCLCIPDVASKAVYLEIQVTGEVTAKHPTEHAAAACADLGVCGGIIGAWFDFHVSDLEAGTGNLFFNPAIQELFDL